MCLKKVFILTYYNFENMKGFLKKYKFIILVFIVFFVISICVVFYILYVWNELIVRDLNYEEYKTCISSPEIKSNRDIKITKKGVCFQNGFCELIDDTTCKKAYSVEDDTGVIYYWGWTIVEDFNKNNFYFEELRGKNDELFYKISFNGVNKNYFINLSPGWGNNWGDKKRNNYVVNDIDLETFQQLGGKYSKDKNNVYYKNEITGADPETFTYKKGSGKTIGKGKDKNGTWIKGILQEK